MEKQTTVEFLARFPEVLGKSDTTSSQEPILIKADMTPKQKANELIDKFSERRKILTETKGWVEYIDSSKAKGHALIAVDEILNHHYQEEGLYLIDKYFWKEVKKELEKL